MKIGTITATPQSQLIKLCINKLIDEEGLDQATLSQQLSDSLSQYEELKDHAVKISVFDAYTKIKVMYLLNGKRTLLEYKISNG